MGLNCLKRLFMVILYEILCVLSSIYNEENIISDTFFVDN